jgi:nucleoid DNA-binding protein
MSAKLGSHPVWNTIKKLLFEYDCVIIPNFGGFVCNREAARIDQVSHLITPPAKKIIFNQNLKTNDGLLVQALAVGQQTPYSEALRIIDDLVFELKQHLDQSKHLDISSFGSFRLNAEANYVFLPERSNSYLYSSYGLEPIQAHVVSEHHAAAKTRLLQNKAELNKPSKRSRAKNVGLKMLTFMLAFMLMLNGYIFLTDPDLAGGAKINTTSITSWFDSLFTSTNTVEVKQEQVVSHKPMVQQQPQQLQQQVAADTINILNLAEVFAAIPRMEEQIEETPVETIEPALPAIEKEIETTVVGSSGYSYHVIGGVFCEEKNARRFFTQLKEKGFEAELLLNKRINCNRVSYRKCNSLQEAIDLMDSLKSTDANPEAWVLTVKE